MQLRSRWIFTGVLALGMVIAPWAASGNGASSKSLKAKPLLQVAPVNPASTPKPKAPAKESAKASLGDAFIAQNTLRIYLDRPVSISVFNARGQLVFHQESQRQMEVVPLQGMPTGFLYLTLRAGQNELTKKLLYTGK
jgi:hypothetical protein